MRTTQQQQQQQARPRASAATVVEVPPATASSPPATAPPAERNNLHHPRKAVQGVPLQDRGTVELVMALTSLATEPADVLATQLAEHELRLVTTSATCDAMFASVLDSMSEDYGAGDGMASPLADIAAAAEQAAAQVRGSSIASDWVPTSAGSTFQQAGGPGTRHALEQLMAQAEYTAMSGSSTAGKDASSVMARVHVLRQQIQAAAASGASSMRAAAASPGPASSSRRVAVGGSKAVASAAAAAAHKAAASTSAALELPRLARAQAAATESFDEDSCGDAAAMPVIPGLSYGRSSSGSASSSSPSSKPAAYPVYADPASTWMAADSADGTLRIITIRAPPALAAAVASGRAASDLTTFESYSLGAKINKSLYSEANALYNRFMPLVLDHLEEAGPSGRVMLCGAGVGGSLAALLQLMFVARGLRPAAFAPAYTLNAPAVLCEVPDFKQWCSKDGCSLQDLDGMMEDLLHRGILSQLGCPQDAVRNIYHTPGAAAAAVQALTPPLSGVAAGSAMLAAAAASRGKQLSSMVHALDGPALQASPYVPQMLKDWMRSEPAAQGGESGQQRLHILNPVGKMMLYMAGGARV